MVRGHGARPPAPAPIALAPSPSLTPLPAGRLRGPAGVPEGRRLDPGGHRLVGQQQLLHLHARRVRPRHRAARLDRLRAGGQLRPEIKLCPPDRPPPCSGTSVGGGWGHGAGTGTPGWLFGHGDARPRPAEAGHKWPPWGQEPAPGSGATCGCPPKPHTVPGPWGHRNGLPGARGQEQGRCRGRGTAEGPRGRCLAEAAVCGATLTPVAREGAAGPWGQAKGPGAAGPCPHHGPAAGAGAGGGRGAPRLLQQGGDGTGAGVPPEAERGGHRGWVRGTCPP